ncbi:MAG: cell division ATP-binding protein FtsE [Leptolyngbyaceae bacterium]|nr:cell division ATP-binding protein FtsE [Leptolyngbyaceae bacterium]
MQVLADPASIFGSSSPTVSESVEKSASSTAPAADSPPEVMVKLQGVTKIYPNGSRGLLGINFEVKKGDFLFITGASGAGKSTLLKLLYGEERPTHGEVMVDNCDLSKLRGDRLSHLRRRIGIVFQDYKLIPRRTVAENVGFVLQAQGFTRKEIHRRLLPALKMVGLHDKAHCFPDQLSGGEQQRVSIARAVVSTPPLLLADEPTGNLDADNSWQVINILKKLNTIGITVIVTTHNEHLVRLSNHPVVQLRDGRLYQLRS